MSEQWFVGENYGRVSILRKDSRGVMQELATVHGPYHEAVNRAMLIAQAPKMLALLRKVCNYDLAADDLQEVVELINAAEKAE